MPVVLYVWQTIVSTLPAVKVYFLAVLGFTAAELLIPAERRQLLRHHFSNLQHVLLYHFVTPFAMIVPTALVAAATSKFGTGFLRLDLEHVLLGIPAMDWPVRNLLLPFVPLLVFDFFYYWHHRLQHTVPSLWVIHRLHHSIESLNALAALRIHWLEEPMRVFTMTIPMALIFNITPVQGAWIAFALGQLAIFIHANLRISFGRLTPVLVGPQLHRLHHSYKPEHLNKNYGAIFPVWDILFGTYCQPKRGEWPATGLGAEQRAGNVLYENALPFRTWGKAAGRWLTQKRPAVRGKTLSG